MPDYFSEEYFNYEMQKQKRDTKNRWLLHTGLFIITFITTTIAGAQWINGEGPYHISQLADGLQYSIAIMFVISFHEFGHYFAAKYHKVDATLPYYIPFPSIPGFLNFGTMGAVIRTKTPVQTKKAMFDIGIAGPIAGFIACLIVLFYGFLTLPGEEYILSIHPDFFSSDYGKDALGLTFGDTLLFSLFKELFAGGGFFPPMSEIYHYPYLCVGWFGLFITAMNMIPVGQLDGGHIAYSMFGSGMHNKIAYLAFFILLLLGMPAVIELVMGLVNFSGYSPMEVPWYLNWGWSGWFIWAMVLYFFVKIQHPPIPDNNQLGTGRMILGYISFLILIISFSPSPFMISFGN